ncbi:MAG: hypothetical protein KBB87_07675, partial [Candidatus Methanofastidiosum sp.]|nr:hypothetical protein [Methanofastidiosum sp.]
ESFIDWMHDIRNSLPGLPGDDVICVDGKTVCNSGNNTDDRKAFALFKVVISSVIWFKIYKFVNILLL